jgi:hypothetical protein
MDANLVVKAIHNEDYPMVYRGKITKKGGDALKQLPNVTIRWVRRSNNRVGILLFRPLYFTLRPPFMIKMPLKTDFAS